MLRILIVDDSRTIRKIVRRSLEAYGYTALEEANDGLEAIEHFKSKTFDCVFTDINMPNMDGYGLLEWLAKQKLLENLEVIAISTEVAKLGSDEMLGLGIDQAIPKPFSKEEFERIAISMLGTIESSRDLKEMPLEYKDEIIVTDDSSSMRGVIKRQLKLYGCHNIYEAENGKVALERINEISMEKEDDRKTILFLDLNMPVMDGLGLIEELEQRGLIDRLKIILLSGSLEMAKNAVDDIHIVAALPKPFKQKEFTSTFTPLITDSLLSKADSFGELKVIDESLEPHDMDSEEFFAYLLSPLYANIDRFLEHKTLKRIDAKLYSTLDSSIYKPIYEKAPFLLSSSQKKLLFSKDALLSLKEKLEDFSKVDFKKHFELHYIKNYTPYIELTDSLSEQKKALNEYIQNIKKIEQFISKNPSKAQEYRKNKSNYKKLPNQKKAYLKT